jgi:uncharacterized membrane protein YgdD (TMEM256/DUF423 family)
LTVSEGGESMGRHERWLGALAALLGGLAVMAGAFASHGLGAEEEASAARWLTMAAQYQLWHALAALLALRFGGVSAALAFLAGCLLFSGSLGALAFGAPGAIGAVTPFGGLAFILGWLLLAARLLFRPERR